MEMQEKKVTPLGAILISLFIVGCLYGAYYFFFKSKGEEPKLPFQTKKQKQSQTTDHEITNGIEIGIAYGTEKKRWLEWAVDQFSQTEDGKKIKINLIPMGSLEGAQALLAGDKRIHVWSPASALYKDVFNQEWEVKQGPNPIVREEALALSPMVFVFWDERYQAFINKYKTVTFATIKQALDEKGGWDAIAGKPDWGLFKFGHTHPNQSNSGLMTLVLMADDYHKKCAGLEMKDIVNVDFQDFMTGIERGVSGLSNSTGNMMREMVLKGPSSYDVLFVYESVVIDYLRNAEGRWGTLRVVYPPQNMWNDNPYYTVNAAWSTKDHQKAAGIFLDFLLTEPVQKESLKHGFRPGNPAVPIRFAESPFVQFQKYGLKIDLTTMCPPPKAEVINNLLASWQRSIGS
jgi:Bacterial extracellular solute-binding protein